MSDYDTDVLVWSERQAALLRRMGAGERVNDQVDWANVAEQIESLGKGDRRELCSRVRTILLHLIKLQASPAVERRAGWRETIQQQRAEVRGLIKQSPSLRPTVPAAIEAEIEDARQIAALALTGFGEAPCVALDAMSFSVDQVLGPWLPD